jgi:hypothetical protein
MKGFPNVFKGQGGALGGGLNTVNTIDLCVKVLKTLKNLTFGCLCGITKCMLEGVGKGLGEGLRGPFV